jgi:hypothetical protein
MIPEEYPKYVSGIHRENMHRFKVGDWVEVIGDGVAADMKQGTILRVLPNSEGPERLNEYEVRFGLKTALHYETQLRSIAFDEH